MNVARLSALSTGRQSPPPPPIPQEITLILVSVKGWVDPRDTVRPEGMKNPDDPIGNRTRDLPACSAVPRLAPQRTPSFLISTINYANVRSRLSMHTSKYFSSSWNYYILSLTIDDVLLTQRAVFKMSLAHRNIYLTGWYSVFVWNSTIINMGGDVFTF
jgi:hypothetical protein